MEFIKKNALVIVLILLVIGVGIYMFIKKDKDEALAPETQPKVYPNPAPPVSVIQNPIPKPYSTGLQNPIVLSNTNSNITG